MKSPYVTFFASKLTLLTLIFFVITILWTAFTIYAYSGKFIDVLKFKKEDIENTRELLDKYKENPNQDFDELKKKIWKD